MKIIKYNTLKSYLDQTESFLLENELNNNIQIGICNSITDKDKLLLHDVFFNVEENQSVIASCIITNQKLLISAVQLNDAAAQLIANYIIDNQFEYATLNGLDIIVEKLLPLLSKKIIQIKSLIVHQLDKINLIETCNGFFKLAELNQIDCIVDYIDAFQIDAELFPIVTKEDIKKNTLKRIEQYKMFTWMHDDRVMSIAAYTRDTNNIGYISLVYTPLKYRGKGYATNLVKCLSEHILLNHSKKSCGLFTDASNPISNKIYYKIGYIPKSNFKVVEFE